MLLRKDRGRHQINHLLSILHRLERCADRDFRLSVADIPADQAVHDLFALHVLFGRLDRELLILRLLKREHFLKFPLPHGIRAVDKSFLFLSRGIKFYQISRDLFYGSTDFGLGTVPLLRAKLV